MMKLTSNQYGVRVELAGLDQKAAFRRSFDVPRDTITAMRFHAQYRDPGKVWRVGGTGVPGWLYAGNFRRHGLREFWFLRRPSGVFKVTAKNVLEIETTGTFARLLVTVPEGEATELIRWFRDGNGAALPAAS